MPGIAKLSMVANSKARRPAKLWRVSSQAVSRPIAAVIGAAIAAISIVAKNEFHAEPEKNSPRGVISMRKPVR